MLVLFTHLQIIDANPPIGFLLPVVNLTRRRGGWKLFFSLCVQILRQQLHIWPTSIYVLKQGLLFRADKSDDVNLPLHSEHTHSSVCVSGELLFDRLAPQQRGQVSGRANFQRFCGFVLPEIAYAQH